MAVAIAEFRLIKAIFTC